MENDTGTKKIFRFHFRWTTPLKFTVVRPEDSGSKVIIGDLKQINWCQKSALN